MLALHNRAKGEHNLPMPSEKNSTFCQHDNSLFFTLPFSPLLPTIETLLRCRHAAVCSICVGHVQLVAEILLEELQSQVQYLAL